MIAGRPTNLWLGLVTALAGFVTVVLVQVVQLDPLLVASLVGSGVTVLGALIAVVAGQPPTLTPGQSYNIETPKGQANYEATVATPPAPTVPKPEPGT